MTCGVFFSCVFLKSSCISFTVGKHGVVSFGPFFPKASLMLGFSFSC